MKRLDTIIEKGLIFLLIFTPMAFGTVQPWSISIMEIIVFTIFGAWLLKIIVNPAASSFANGRQIEINKIRRWVMFLLALLVLLIIFQIAPLPPKVLASISPTAGKVYGTFADDGDAIWRTISLYPTATRDELLKFIAYAMLFFVIINHYKTRSQVDRVVRAIIYMGCFLAVFAVIQKLTWNGRLFWFYPVEGLCSNVGYIWGSYINHNHFAGYMEMAIPLGFGLFLYKVSSSDATSHSSLTKRLMRLAETKNLMPIAFALLAVVIMSGILFLSLSRGGILGFTASIFFFAMLARTRRSLRKKVKFIALTGIFIFFTVIVASWSQIEDRFMEIGEEEKIKRVDIWRDTMSMVREFPVFGVGFGAFKNIYRNYQTEHPRTVFDHAENDYIEILAETGFICLTAILTLVLLYLYSVIKTWRQRQNMFVKCIVIGGLSSVVAIVVHSFTDFNTRIPANMLLLTVIAGITYAAVFNVSGNGMVTELPENTLFKLNKKQRVSLLIAAAFVLIALLSFPARTLMAGYYYTKAVNTIDDTSTEYRDALPISQDTMSNYMASINALEQTSALLPSDSAYYAELSNIYGRLGRWAESMAIANAQLPQKALLHKDAYEMAIKHIKKAVFLEPTNADYHLSLGKLYEITNSDAVIIDKEFNRAINADPVNVYLRYAIAMHYLNAGRNGDAIEQARILAKIDDSYIVPDSASKKLIVEAWLPEYISRLYKSHLFKAFEIAWRASKDPLVVKGIAPDNPDAKEALELFMEWKGIEP